MFNISRLTQYFNTLHSFAPKTNQLYPPVLLNEQPEVFFARNSEDNQASTSEKERGRVAERKAENKKKDVKKNKEDDDNDNENGGFLQPILEDLQGFLQGKRRLAPAVLSL